MRKRTINAKNIPFDFNLKRKNIPYVFLKLKPFKMKKGKDNRKF